MNDFFNYTYETFFQFYRDGFSSDLYDNSMYGLVGTVTVGWAVLMSALYYFSILAKRSDTWARWNRWLLFGIVAACIPPFLFSWLHPKANFEAQGLNYQAGDYMALGFWSAILAFLAYTLISNLLFRWITPNGKSVPFPG